MCKICANYGPTLVAITLHPIINLVSYRNVYAVSIRFLSLSLSFLSLCYCFDGEIIAGRRDAIIKLVVGIA